jgi:hypothetical protein
VKIPHENQEFYTNTQRFISVIFVIIIYSFDRLDIIAETYSISISHKITLVVTQFWVPKNYQKKEKEKWIRGDLIKS